MMLSLIAAACLASQPELPQVLVDRDNVRIERSCRVRIAPGAFIEDADGNGVIHVVADGVTIEWAAENPGREMLAREDETRFETMAGVGIRIDGRKDVTIRGAHLHRYKLGIWATRADGLRLEECDVAGGYAMRLGSTPQAEDGADWLWPHANDGGEWRDRYGAGIVVEQSRDVTIAGCFARRRQNGIILDRVTDSRVYDNDMSFLSGWGLAMWRSSGNTVSRNAFDFCVRGYSHGVYNRGQDSAGILMFEQCSGNVIAENSCTHGGDGIFVFAGREALGEGAPEGMDHTRRGCNDNLFIGNDLSYAAAHGLEVTFSFGNRVFENRFVENAICGIWGGYSKDTLIAMNEFVGNGEGAYGLERGGVNIEHGARNTIRNNRFEGNRCGVHLWDDADEHLRSTPWAEANGVDASDSLITENAFVGDAVAVHLRDASGTTLLANRFENVGEELRTEGEAPVSREGFLTSSAMPRYEAMGDTTPVGDRSQWRGRQFIVMGEYFPWDFRDVLVRPRSTSGSAHEYEVFGVGDRPFGHTVEGPAEGAITEFSASRPVRGAPAYRATRVTLRTRPGVHPYSIRLFIGDEPAREIGGTIVATRWEIAAFATSTDPREEAERWIDAGDAWRGAIEGGDGVLRITRDELDLAYGMGGPSDAGFGAGLAPDRFATVARTTVPLTAGRWRIETLSDDGVRVFVDGEALIDNWTWHGPTTDVGEFELEEDRDVEVLVLHFELDGYSVLRLGLSRAP